MEININPTKNQTVSDDPELAKVLAGVNSNSATDAPEPTEEQEIELNYEPTEGAEEFEQSDAGDQQFPAEDFTASAPVAGLGNLDNIKNLALQDLRPLVDKLNVSNEEKFDIYLLLLRSSDDKTLIEPAYNAARLIEDETKRANSLLDVIKEIDYLNSKK